MVLRQLISALFLSIALSLVSPPASLGAGGLGDMVFDDKIDSMKEAGVGPVVFPHTRHEELYSCNDCHPDIFKDKRGANNMTMKDNMDGRYCGTPACHDSIGAFPLYMCNRCHTNVKQPQ